MVYIKWFLESGFGILLDLGFLILGLFVCCCSNGYSFLWFFLVYWYFWIFLDKNILILGFWRSFLLLYYSGSFFYVIYFVLFYVFLNVFDSFLFCNVSFDLSVVVEYFLVWVLGMYCLVLYLLFLLLVFLIGCRW